MSGSRRFSNPFARLLEAPERGEMMAGWLAAHPAHGREAAADQRAVGGESQSLAAFAAIGCRTPAEAREIPPN